jgi:D-lactate dehydrogenase (cytochrome)
MLKKSDPDEIQSYLSDASYLSGGFASEVVFPESDGEVSELLAGATRAKTPVTVSGAGTGTVAGRVPFGGIVLATDRLNAIRNVEHLPDGGRAKAECGVRLAEVQQRVESEGLFYPPDPTERSCFLGGTIATNASGARTFKYGPTRKYVERLKIALATGDLIELRRGELHADARGNILIPLKAGAISAQLPSYHMPEVRKNASGYYAAPNMDVIDLFIGSEGTLGVIVDADLKLLAKPSAFFSGVVFFRSCEDLLAFVYGAREISLKTRATESFKTDGSIDARVLEYFDQQSLGFLKQKYASIPEAAVGAVFFEQETTNSNEDQLLNQWLQLLDRNNALLDESWFATNEPDQTKLREFRHQLPVLMNEWFARYNQRKISTDMAVPDKELSGMLEFYDATLRPSGLRYTIFGHIGDNHVHVNILPRDDQEAERARKMYLDFVAWAIKAGGTVSAEHGIGKLKRLYFKLMYGEIHLREMAALKRAFDPAGILGRGNIFAEQYLG